MMKFFLVLVFMIPLSFVKNSFWFNQCLYMVLDFLFLGEINLGLFYSNISYMMGVDLLSYIMILLSLWICSLMIMASEGILKNNYFYNLYLFTLLILSMVKETVV